MEEPSFVKTYRLEERKFLHEEVIKRLEREASIEIQTIFATAAIYAFLFTSSSQVDSNHGAGFLLQLAWFLPPFVVILGYTRWLLNSRFLNYLGSYIKAHEDYTRTFDSSFEGWTYHLDRRRRTGRE